MTDRTYVETSIPSFYVEVRQQPEMHARPKWTRAWWTKACGTVELVTSLAVVDELQRGEFPARGDCLRLIASLPVLAVDPPVLEIVQA